MKGRFLFLLLATCSTVLATAQTTIANSDGTYSLFYYSSCGSTIIFPDGSHALLVDYDSTYSILVYPDFSFSRIFYNGSATTIVHPDYSYSILFNDAPTSAAVPPPSNDTSFSNSISDAAKNATDTGYILLSDDVTIKPDPGEARYILLNTLVDTATMRSMSLLPEPPLSAPVQNQHADAGPDFPPTGYKQPDTGNSGSLPDPVSFKNR